MPKAKEALERVKDAKVPFVCLTNSGGKIESKRAEHYSHLLGTDVPQTNLVQSHTPMRRLVPELGTKRILVLSHDDESAHAIMDE